jgi:hypothetical protein
MVVWFLVIRACSGGWVGTVHGRGIAADGAGRRPMPPAGGYRYRCPVVA